MNFFKSILADDPDTSKPEIPHEYDPNSASKLPRDDSNTNDVTNGWSFGGLIKTIAERSESVIETYSRDLKEFGSGIRKETEIFRETASQAVKDLPASLEARASAAHGALDGVLKSTAGIISKESLSFASDGESETPETNRSLNSGRYRWFEAQLRAIQSDLNTFCEDPEDLEEYRKWKLGFELEKKKDEIDSLIGDNGALEGVYKGIVPSAVDSETFWCRYFYRVDKLMQQERVRANLVRRAISVDDEEELSWDVDDDEEYDNGSERVDGMKVKGGNEMGDNVARDGKLDPVEKKEDLNSEMQHEKKKGGSVNVDDGEKSSVVELSSEDVCPELKEMKSGETADGRGKNVTTEESVTEKNDEHLKIEGSVKEKIGEKVGVDEEGESGKKGATSGASSHPSKVEEEVDLEWDEIADLGSGDDKKIWGTTHGGGPSRDDLRRRLNVTEDDEDLSWDIEDED